MQLYEFNNCCYALIFFKKIFICWLLPQERISLIIRKCQYYWCGTFSMILLIARIIIVVSKKNIEPICSNITWYKLRWKTSQIFGNCILCFQSHMFPGILQIYCKANIKINVTASATLRIQQYCCYALIFIFILNYLLIITTRDILSNHKKMLILLMWYLQHGHLDC